MSTGMIVANPKTGLQYWRPRIMQQGELADALGINRAYLSQWENGRSIPPREMMERIADILEKPITSLFDIE